jgi:oxygen-independent coproporphyrinogen-3 oxidase
MNASLIQRYAVPVPRYTSYPTANHFGATVGADDYRAWLQALAPGSSLSLYLHIPYCRELCHYCGCNTKATHKYRPVADYLTALEAEIGTVSGLVPASHSVAHIHWGGGSPNILEASDILQLGDSLASQFTISPNAKFAVEIDARELHPEQVVAFAQIGVNRVSLGVQDFNETVQRAIGRMQSYETTRQAVEYFRDEGIRSINIDLVYGLPHQTEDSVARTIEQVLSLDPDRIAIFGYAHLPQRLKHQRLIDNATLPGAMERLKQSQRVAAMLKQAGFVALGLDHFARRTDDLSSKPLTRNFQGYTTEIASALIGLGASAISRLPQGFAQNEVAVDSYSRRLVLSGLATARGSILTSDDRVRAHVIERLMCDFTLSESELKTRFGPDAEEVVAAARGIVADDADGLVEATDDGFRMTERGRPFVRNICARFDAYLPQAVEQRRHALAV